MNATIGHIYVKGLLVLGTLLAASACSPSAKDSSRLQSSAATPDSRPAESESTLSQLKRYVGQKSFLTLGQQHFAYPGLASSKAAESDAVANDGGGRVIQEADLFKVGKTGSKILYTLNPYRGLQVIDFAEGEANPRLLGRSDVSGHEQVEMYFDEAHMQILVTERRYDPNAGAMGRLVVFSVQDPTRPVQTQVIDLPGDIADSRLVGNILYVASSREAYYPVPGGEGWIGSYRLHEGGASQVASYQLTLPVQNNKSLNIIESLEGEEAKYYLVSVQALNSFNWNERQSSVEVIDVSDAAGKIQPLMMVSTEGELRERSGTHIHKGSLITVSNTWINNAEGTGVRRVSVETFALPTDNVVTIDEAEGEFRRAWFEREMKKRPKDVSAEELSDRLSRDPEYGMKGVFVKREDGRLSKIFPDQAIRVGDSTGMHADLQDVRFVNDKLYVFWVPANQVDPLDVFDISAPSENLVYLGRTLFDGWMERAIPLTFKGEDYILGLGWIVPAVGDNTQRRPQAMIFKLPRAAGDRVQTVAQLTLNTPDLFSYFNDQDKSITVRSEADGTGSIIFPASTWTEAYQGGGKIIAYDLAATAGAQLKEGAFLLADSSWLRRVFSNPELDRVQALSDRALSTFPLDTQSFGKAGQIIEAVSILELARDIRGYSQIAIAGQDYGVQLVELTPDAKGNSQTEVRVVPSKAADAELNSVLQRSTLPGRYVTHKVSSSGELFLLTSSSDLINIAQPEQGYVQKQILHRIRFADQGAGLSAMEKESVSWDAPAPVWGGFYKMSIFPAMSQAKLYEISPSRVLVIDGEILRSVSLEGEMKLSEHADALACLPAEAEEKSYHVLGQTILASYAIPVADTSAEFHDQRILRNYVTSIDGKSLRADCGRAVNIPGRPVRILNDQLITEENRFLGFEESVQQVWPETHENVDGKGNAGEIGDDIIISRPQTYRWAQTARVLYSVRWLAKSARLQDLYSLEDVQGNLFEDKGTSVHLEQAQEWSPRLLVRLNLGEKGRFERKALIVPQQSSQDVQLVALISSGKDSLFMIRSGQEGVLYSEKENALRPSPVRIVWSNGSLSKPQSNFPLFDWFSGEEGNRSRIAFDEETGSIAVAQGLWGIQQLLLAEPKL